MSNYSDFEIKEIQHDIERCFKYSTQRGSLKKSNTKSKYLVQLALNHDLFYAIHEGRSDVLRMVS